MRPAKVLIKLDPFAPSGTHHLDRNVMGSMCEAPYRSVFLARLKQAVHLPIKEMTVSMIACICILTTPDIRGADQIL